MRTGNGMAENDRVVASLQFRHDRARASADFHPVDHRADAAAKVAHKTFSATIVN